MDHIVNQLLAKNSKALDNDMGDSLNLSNYRDGMVEYATSNTQNLAQSGYEAFLKSDNLDAQSASKDLKGLSGESSIAQSSLDSLLEARSVKEADKEVAKNANQVHSFPVSYNTSMAVLNTANFMQVESKNTSFAKTNEVNYKVADKDKPKGQSR